MREIGWTERSEDRIARHGVHPSEAEEVIGRRPLWAARGPGHTTMLFGRTRSGRHLLVVMAGGVDGPRYVAAAREMTLRERRTFRRAGRDIT